ncbi:MAG: metal-sensitive transcriptional regulator [Gemmatimonadales bacterium]
MTDPAPCACGSAAPDRHAVAVDPELKAAMLTRLRRIEGQVRGLHRMVEEERYCADIITQVSSVQEALRSLSRTLLRNHLQHCATSAIRSENPAVAEAMYDELVDLMYRGAR